MTWYILYFILGIIGIIFAFLLKYFDSKKEGYGLELPSNF